jgi:hypothetical protein
LLSEIGGSPRRGRIYTVHGRAALPFFKTSFPH